MKIHNIFNKRDYLPYTSIGNSKIKLLIHTGATKSLLDPDIAENYFSDYIFEEPFT